MMALFREILDVLFAGLWQGAAIALAVAAMLALAGRRLNATTRCVILQGAVIAVAIVPLVTTLPRVATEASFIRILLGSTLAQGVEPRGALTMMAPQRIDVVLSDRAALILAELWLAGVLVFIARIAAGSLQLARLLRRSLRLADREGVRIFESYDIGVPLAVGFARAAIVVPAALAARPGDEFECIVLHELAHIRRGDAYANACGRAIHALLFFNPAVLLLLRAVALEREVACDDWAVARSHDLARYTTSLATFALSGSRAGSVGAFTTSGFGRAIVARIDRLEDKRRNGATTLAFRSLGGFGLVFLTIGLIVQGFMPAIAFASQPLSDPIVASTACRASEVRYVSGPAPTPKAHVPNGLTTLVRVIVSASGRASGATVFKSSGDIVFDRAVIDAAKKGVYSPQTQNCRPLAGSYIFEATTG